MHIAHIPTHDGHSGHKGGMGFSENGGERSPRTDLSDMGDMGANGRKGPRWPLSSPYVRCGRVRRRWARRPLRAEAPVRTVCTVRTPCSRLGSTSRFRPLWYDMTHMTGSSVITSFAHIVPDCGCNVRIEGLGALRPPCTLCPFCRTHPASRVKRHPPRSI